MTYKDKLIDLLKSDDETREAMEKLEFGSKVTYKKNGKIYYNTYIGISPNNRRQIIQNIYPGCANSGKVSTFNKNDLLSVKNNLQERFIRMYCENKKKYSNFYSDGDLYIQGNESFIKLDNTKDFDNQSEEVYSKIYEALNN